MTKFYNIPLKILFLNLCMAIVFSHKMFSQKVDLYFEKFPVGQNTPNNVQQILQDSTGYLWFATWSGLYKYDGYDFVYYKHDPDDKTSIKDNNIFSLYEDKDCFLWIGSSLGLEKYDRSKNTFFHFELNPENTGDAATNTVLSICEDKFGMLWIGTSHGLYKFNVKKEKFVRFIYDSNNPWSISDNSIQKIYLDKKGNLWIGTGAGLNKYDYETGKFIHYWNDPRNKYKQGELSWTNSSVIWINTIFEDEFGTIWLGTNGGLVEFNPQKETFFSYKFDQNTPQNRITSICRDEVTGSLWLANWFGLYTFNRKSKEFIRYNYQGITEVFSEKSGTKWVGTNKNIMKLNRRRQPFKTYPSNEIIWAMGNGSDGIIWMFTYYSRLKFDIKKDKFVPYSFGKGNELYFVYPGAELIIRTKKGGCYRIDSLDNKKPFLNDSLKDFNNSLSWGCRTKDGYWISTHLGELYFLNPKTLKLRRVRDFKFGINYIYEDYIGLLWISTTRGPIYSYNPAKDTLIEFTLNSNSPSNIRNLVVNQIYEDKKRRLWFATSTGLNELERSTNSFNCFTEINGLPSENIRGILEDDHGILWLNTTNGISKFDPDKNQFKNYDTSYGLELPAEVYYGFGCKTSNGEMFFPGANGFTRFHPDSIKDNPFIPPIVITSFKKFDKPYPFSDRIELPYDENFLSFEFAALSYISPERNQYAYKMVGVDKDWVYSGIRRYASYPNLSPGKYIFKVKGSNNDGVWNEAGTSILIIISPPWWKTWWSYSFYILLFAGVIYSAWRFQINQIRLKHRAEIEHVNAAKILEIDRMKSQFFANISHEFRTPLTLILGPIKQIIDRINDDNTRDDLKVVHKNANRLLVLVNQLLDISKLESGSMKLHASSQNIIPLIKALLQSFSSYAERKRINLKFNSDHDEIIVYLDRDKIEKILTNVLSNALKFTPEGGLVEVAVTLKSPSVPPLIKGETACPDLSVALAKGVLKRSYVEITIRDTGIGIPLGKIPKIFDRFYQVDGSVTREQEGTGIGLSLTKELVELHKGKIKVESEEGKGSTFTISIPLGREHLKPEEICEQNLSFRKEPFGQIPASRDFSEEIIFPKGTKTEKHNIDLIAETSLSVDKVDKPFLLLVEDNTDVRNYIRNNLDKDYRIIEAVDGEDGWNKSIDSTTGGPDLIVSDVMMPKMDGFILCNKIKTDERTSHIPVILLTAKATSQDKIEGFETGADDYIMKPFDSEELKARIKNLINQRKRIHEHLKKHGLFEIEEKNITPIDEKFLQKTVEAINKNMSDASFGVERLADILSVSRSLLLKKIGALVGESPNDLIKRTRMNKAAKLIRSKFGNISEIALEVGYNNPSYFAECFKKQFGISPSQYH